MTRRMIDSAIWSNESFAALPVMARLLQVGIINMADDQGRVKAFPAYLRSQIFPYDDVALADITAWLALIAQNGTILVYQAEGKEYIQLLNWWEYQSLQYPAPSEYPASPEWKDRIRYNAKGGSVLTHNWTTIKGEALPDTCDPRGNPLGRPGGIPSGKASEKPSGGASESPLGAPIQLEDQLEKEDQQEKQDDEDDAQARELFESAWQEAFQAEMPPKIRQAIGPLAKDCGKEAVVFAIQAAAGAGSRTFGYIAKTARNYVPPAPAPASNGHGRYSVDLPGVVHMEPPKLPTTVQPPAVTNHIPAPSADPWATVLDELRRAHARSDWIAWLDGSRLEAAGTAPDGYGKPVPHYLLHLCAGGDIRRLKERALKQIRFCLATVFGHSVMVDFVAAIEEKEGITA